MTRRIGILNTNTDYSDFASHWPGDGQRFTSLLSPLRPDWVFTNVDVRFGEFPARAEDFDGYVIGGSPSSVHDQEPWIERLKGFIREIDEKRIPTVGICFGHQAIAVALGGKVEKKAWGLGLAPTQYAKREPWMEPWRPTIKLHSAHGEQVTQLPPAGERLGGDAFCPIGAFKVGQHMMTTEYHPELGRDFMTGLVEEMAPEIPPEIAGKARADLQGDADNKVFAEWMVRFLEMPRP